MSQKEARGKKRTCQSCAARFYDLNRDPITCPMCQTEFVVTAGETAAVAAVEAAKIKPIKEKVFAVPDVVPAEGDLPELESTEALAEIESEDTEIAGEDAAEDTFLEEEEGEESDVAGLIDSPVEGEEET